MNRKLIIFLLVITFAALTANTIENWWSGRDNNLFNNGRWIVGKDTGKFLFYTYKFMFDPLKDTRVNLNSHMGFQELLYGKAETKDQRLKKLSFTMEVGGGAYLWVLLRKDGMRTFACRLSHRSGYDPGFYTFNNKGEMIEHIPFPNGMPKIESSRKQKVDLELIENQWNVKIDGQEVGSAPDPKFKNGQLGFRGSGALRAKNTIDSLQITWENAGKLKTEFENFDAPPTTYTQWMFILLCALSLTILRFLRSWSISRCLPSSPTLQYIYIDFALASFLIVAITQTIKFSEPVQFGLIFLLLEFFSFAVFAWLIHKHGLVQKIPIRSLVVYIIISSTLAGISLYIHGDWAGRRQHPPAAAIAESYPNAVIRYPLPVPTLNEFVKTKPFTVSFGQPFSTENIVFNQQEITIDFIMPRNTTFDICFQQQSFFSRGDPEGEPLPLQRRLVRLSTVESVSNGVATKTGRQPEPFIPLQGNLLTDKLNSIIIKSTVAGLSINLNGKETPLNPSLTPLGYGETLFMTYEQPVKIQRLAIRAAENKHVKRYFLPILGLLSFPLIALGLALLLRITGNTTAVLACLGAVVITYPIYNYLAVILFAEPSLLSRISLDRLTVLDFAIAASAWAILYCIPLHAKRIKHPALLANFILIVHIGCLTFLIWDIFLPPEHFLKTRFASTHTKPGELITTDLDLAPWYTSNSRIGSNMFVWKQQFDGRRISLDKGQGNMRIFILGGSQAWGSGAKSTRETFSGLLDQLGRQQGLPVEVINAGVNGAGIANVHDIFFNILPHYNTDLIILDIGLNDSASGRKKTNVNKELSLFREIAETCSKKNIDLILVHEPMSSESALKPNKGLYSGFADIAEEYGFQVVDALSVLARAERIEMTWWDPAHLSPRGHSIMAETIFPAMEKSIEKRLTLPANKF